ncbi:hypothetical protein C8A01DRAFT_34482 [Parachaetomium inaequale]|uniref:Fibronectin type-III domain-containing protein n=1 Tax=Parachaetomium inaequale TaxID=2588326 RepID=A0AAN6PID1_9PEZI|nr:hypothetical protein C8A01DRAFT_34482 [Parachaetomium inaequale]
MAKIAVWAILALALSLSGPVLAAVSFTNSEYYIHEGAPFTITWTGNQGPVGVNLMKGPDENLELVFVIVSASEAQEYTWTPPPTLPADSYILQLEDAGSTDYSPRFRYPVPLPSTTSTTGNSGPTPTPSTPTINPSSSTSTSPSTSPPPSTTETTTPPSTTGTAAAATLSTPAIAAIATLGGLLLLALIALCVYYTAYRRRKRGDILREEGGMGGMGNHEMSFGVSSPSGTTDTYMQSPGTVPGSAAGGGGVGYGGHGGYGGGTVHMKVAGGGENHGVGHRQQGQVYERAELPVRGWGEDVELSAEGRYLQ